MVRHLVPEVPASYTSTSGGSGKIDKGQLISKANFLGLIWTKKRTKLFFDIGPKDLK